MTKVLKPSAPATDVLKMIAKELDGVATPTSRSPEKQQHQMDNEVDGMKTPPDSPTKPKAKQARRVPKKAESEPLSCQLPSEAEGPILEQGVGSPVQAAAVAEKEPPPSPQVKLEHALFINEQGKVQVRVYDTLEIRAAFLRCCNSRCRPDEMHRVGMHPPSMTAHQFMAMCRDLELMEPAGPLSLMDVGVTFTTRQEKQRDEGLSYIGFMDTLMDLSLETGRNIAAKLQEDNKDWQSHFDEMRNTMMRGIADGNSMRRSEAGLPSGSLRRQPSPLRRSESSLNSLGRPLCGSRGGSRMSEPGAHGGAASIVAAAAAGRLSESGGMPPVPPGVGGRFTRMATFRQGSHASILPTADGVRNTASRGSMRRTLNSSMGMRNSCLTVVPDLPVNPLHAAVLNLYSPTAPDTPSPPHGRLASARLKNGGGGGGGGGDDHDKKDTLPQVDARPSSGRPCGMPPKPKSG